MEFSRVYVTKSTVARVADNVDLSTIDINQEVFRVGFKWFSTSEIEALLAFKMFLNLDEFFQRHKIRRIAKKEYVVHSNFPSYHSQSSCERILSDFDNYLVPKEIQVKGEKTINEFRRWFKTHAYLLDKDLGHFQHRLKSEFSLQGRPEVIEFQNSSIAKIENSDLERLEAHIETLIKNADVYYSANKRHRRIIDNFGKFSFIYKEKIEPIENKTKYTNEHIWDVLREFEEKFKNPIIYYLREYYRVKFNSELEFDGRVLERLGFLPCQQCHNTEYFENFERRTEEIRKTTVAEASKLNIEDLAFEPSSTKTSRIVRNQIFIKLFENEEFTISTDLDKFKSEIEQCLEHDTNVVENKYLLQLILHQYNTYKGEVDAMELTDKTTLKWRLRHTTADLLEKGKCYVYNKATKEIVSKIEVSTHRVQIAPLGGEGGRTFFANGIQLYEVQDWVS